MKNWSKAAKIIFAILVIILILLVLYQMKWLGNKKTLLEQFGYGSFGARQYRAGGGLGFVPAIPGGGGGIPITPVERPGSILNYPTTNVAYHKCDEADVLLATHGVHGQCIGKNGTVNY